MSDALELTIREAIPSDAAELLTVSRKIGEETEFLVMDEKGIEKMERLIERLEELDDVANIYHNWEE